MWWFRRDDWCDLTNSVLVPSTPPPVVRLNPSFQARVGARCHLKDVTDTPLSPARKHLCKCDESLCTELLACHKCAPEFALKCVKKTKKTSPVVLLDDRWSAYSLESEPLEFITNTCTIETKILEHVCVHQHKKLLLVLWKYSASNEPLQRHWCRKYQLDSLILHLFNSFWISEPETGHKTITGILECIQG